MHSSSFFSSFFFTSSFECVSLSLAAIGSSETCNGVPGLCDMNFNRVTLPAAHKSGTFNLTSSAYGETQPYKQIRRNLGTSQTLSFREQLEAGIRAVDIEPCCSEGENQRNVSCRRATKLKLDSLLLLLLQKLLLPTPDPNVASLSFFLSFFDLFSLVIVGSFVISTSSLTIRPFLFLNSF